MPEFISKQYTYITQSISDGMITLGLDGRVKTLNPAAEHLLGWDSADVCDQWLPADSFFEKAEFSDVDFPFHQCIDIKDIAGDKHYVELRGSVVHDRANKPLEYILLFTEVTLAKKLAELLTTSKEKDSLTGAYDRKSFIKQLTTLLTCDPKGTTPNAMIYLDINQLKLFNDQCGATNGDVLLQKVAQLITANTRATDIFFRVGGDEFVVILPGCRPKPAHLVATKIAEAINEYEFDCNDAIHSITANLGLLNIQGQYSDISEVMRDANIACTLAKQDGKGLVYQLLHTQKDVILYKSKLDWFSRINNALEAQRFVLYFQSIVPTAARGGGVHGEVLIRLLDDEGDVISPGEFMPSVEHFQMTSKLDAYVIDHVFDFLEYKRNVIQSVSMMSINLSGQSVNDESFRQYLYNKISHARFELSKICFEITETIALENMKETVSFIKQLKKLGVKFALDDFGSGASSFSYLKKLPIDYLKIDGQFIVNFDQDEVSQLTVECLTKIAKISGAETIAEWVESSEVDQALKAAKVDYVQGYYHHKPERMDDFFKPYISELNTA